MPGTLFSHNITDGHLIIGAYPVSGAAEDMLSVEWDANRWDLYVGADGDSTRSRINNGAATATLRLAPHSPLNELLSVLANADNSSGGGGVIPFFYSGGGSTLTAAQCYVERMPNFDVSVQAENMIREWMIKIPSLTMVVGGMSAA